MFLIAMQPFVTIKPKLFNDFEFFPYVIKA